MSTCSPPPSFRTFVRSCLKAVADLVFPPFCLVCGQGVEDATMLFCPHCRETILMPEPPYCSCCGIPFPSGGERLCGVCLQKRWNFDQARAVLIYNDTVAPSLLSFKFKGRKTALSTFTSLMQLSRCCGDLADPDIIVPVPLHLNRLRQRGFNQALLLARHLVPQKKHKIRANLLLRIRDTPPQTGLDGRQRRKNLRHAFAVAGNEEVRGKTVLVVDDVFTTGSTVDGCSAALKKAGALRVEVLTLARVDQIIHR